MAPIPDISLDTPTVLVSAAGFLVAIVTALLCADSKSKPKKMEKVGEFSNINKTGTAPRTPLKLDAIVPIMSPEQPAENKSKKSGDQKLKFDAARILRDTFKDDKILTKLAIDEKRLNMTDIIGHGNFGLVYRGILTDKNLANPRPVAIKTIQGPTCTWEDAMQFVRESARMRGFSHQHVLCITGVLTKDNKPYIVLPYMENGDLKSYVANKSKKFTVEDLIRLAYHVAQGMSYLSSKNFVHRDLAARNCMVSGDGTVKVADFGLSRDLYEADYYRMSDLHTPLPIRWVALESILSSKFTSKSDVWSFGVLVWELLTRGRTPYPNISNNIDVVKSLKEGKRMDCPQYVTDSICRVTKKCWLANPGDRPTFPKLCDMIHYILEEEGDYVRPQKTK